MRLTRFSGLLPTASARHLPRGHGTVAENTRTTNGTLRAIRSPKAIGSCASQYGLTAAGAYECVANCSVSTASGCGAERIGAVNGVLTYLPGSTPVIPAAPDAPNVVTSGADNGVATAFRVSRLNEYGSESPPSASTEVVTAYVGQRVRLNTTGEVRVYALLSSSLDGKVSQDGTPTAQWVTVGDFSGAATFNFSPENWTLAEDSAGDEQCAPKNVKCVTRDESGYYYAWSETEVWISDRNTENQWPTRGHVTLEHNIRHAVAFYDSLLVVTDGVPFVIRPSPTNDGSLSPATIPYTGHHGLVGTAAAVTLTSTGLAYPSRMGLIGLTPAAPNGYQLLTRNVVNQEEWQEEWTPSILAYHNGVLASEKWLFDMNDAQHGTNQLNTFSTHTFPMDRLQSLPDGRLIGFKGGTAYEWFSGNYARAVYESEINVEQGFRVFTAAKIVGKNLAGVTFTLYDVDSGDVIHEEVLENSSSNEVFRMAPCRAIHYKFRFVLPAGPKEVRIDELHIGPDINDLTRAEGDNA